MGFPGGSDCKDSACNAEDPGLIPGLGKSPEEKNGYSVQYSCLENPHGLRNLVGYNPWGHKESDMTERTYMSTSYIAKLGKSTLYMRVKAEYICRRVSTDTVSSCGLSSASPSGQRIPHHLLTLAP